MKNKINALRDNVRKFGRNLRNVFTGEMEDELSNLSKALFATYDELEELKDEVRRLEV